MEAKKGNKVVVIGVGKVGATIAYALSIRSNANELVLVDVDKERAEGEAMDISHGLAFLREMAVRAGTYEDCRDADVIVMAAGAPRKSGQTRLDLAETNVRIAKSVAKDLKENYGGAPIVVVSNPVDVITYKLAEYTGIPQEKVIGSGTVLDSNRLRYLLSEKFHVDIRNVHAYVIGEHGDSQFITWSKSNIAGFDIDEYCSVSGIDFPEEEREAIATQVRTAGAEIIKRKGATYYGIGIATANLVDTILGNYGTIRPVGTFMHGEYGVDDVVLNVPAKITAAGIEQEALGELTDDEVKRLHASAEAVKTVIKEVSARIDH